MKYFSKFLFYSFIILAIHFLPACENADIQLASNEGGISGTGDGTSIAGGAYKGPLIEGSVIQIHKVVNGEVSSEFVQSSVLSNKGDFLFEYQEDDINNDFFSDINTESVFSVVVKGLFYDENTGRLSKDTIELKALVQFDVETSATQTLYVNSLTHLAHDFSLLLLLEGETFKDATSLAKERVLKTLSTLVTGGQVVESEFSNMSLINSPDTISSDNSFLLYFSALLTKATTINQDQNPNIDFSEQDLFDTLIQYVIDDLVLSGETLDLLDTAHELLDAEQIASNLATVLVGETIATVSETLDAISINDFHTAFVITAMPTLRRFCYEGAAACDLISVTGGINFNGSYLYELQVTEQGDGFSDPFVAQRTPRNTISITSSVFEADAFFDARLRKVGCDVYPSECNGPYSAWVGISFIGR